MQIHDLAVEWDSVHEEWRCQLDRLGRPTVVTKSLEQMELFLDWYELLRCKERKHVDTGTQTAREY